MPAPLEMVLRSIGQGTDHFTDELWEYYGGDALLEAIRQYDPNARVVDTDIGGGEAGPQGRGKKIEFDHTKLPSSKMGTFGLDLRPSNAVSGGLYNDRYVIDDENYGEVTNSKNLKHGGMDWWEMAAPLAIAALAPMAAGALAGAGIGGAGLTSAVTGSGLGASAPSWMAGLVKGGPSMMDKLSRGDFASILPILLQLGGQTAGVNPALMKGGMTIAQLARGGR
jgi:hypothetical protein